MSTTAQPNTTSTSERTFAAGLKSTRFRFLPGAGAASWSVAAPDVAAALTPTVRLIGEAVVARCKCARCAVRPEAEDGGCTLPLPQPQRGRGGGAS